MSGINLEIPPRIPNGRIKYTNGMYYLIYKSAEYELCRANELNYDYLEYMADRKISSIQIEESLRQWK